MNKWNNVKTDNLLQAIISLKNLSEAKKFLRDLLTEQELIEFGNRWQAAQMLNERKTYVEIGRKTKLSTRTIARISSWLKGGMGGYQLMLNRVHHSRHRKVAESG